MKRKNLQMLDVYRYGSWNFLNSIFDHIKYECHELERGKQCKKCPYYLELVDNSGKRIEPFHACLAYVVSVASIRLDEFINPPDELGDGL